MLLRLPEFRDARIVRTRNPGVLNRCDVVVDVGGVYDHARRRYDHHQRGFDERCVEKDADDHHEREYGNNDSRVKLSSAGLIYRHYGRRIVRDEYDSWHVSHVPCPSRPPLRVVVENERRESGRLVSDEARYSKERERDVDDAFVAMYEGFVKAVDAVDNGIDMFRPEQADRDEGSIRLVPTYRQTTSLSCRVARMNGGWNEPYSGELQYERFLAALKMVGHEFDDMLRRDVLKLWLPGKRAVAEAMAARKRKGDNVDPVLELSVPCPWRDHVHALEDPPGSTLYVVYPVDFETSSHGQQTSSTSVQAAKGCRWRVQAVNVAPGSFVSRKPLPEAWRGLAGDNLSRASGVPGCVFAHASGFIGGNETREGAMQMARLSLLDRFDVLGSTPAVALRPVSLTATSPQPLQPPVRRRTYASVV